jgi:hypothetical protein
MYIIALFILHRLWNQPKWPSTGEWIEKQYIYNCIYIYIYYI